VQDLEGGEPRAGLGVDVEVILTHSCIFCTENR
jgi:hypothetical protein